MKPCPLSLMVRCEKEFLPSKNLPMNSKQLEDFFMVNVLNTVEIPMHTCRSEHLPKPTKILTAWVKNFKNAQNPNLQPSAYNPELNYMREAWCPFRINLWETQMSENFVLTKLSPRASSQLSKKIGTKAHSDDYEHGKQLFSSLQCVQCHAINRTGLVRKVLTLPFLGFVLPLPLAG